MSAPRSFTMLVNPTAGGGAAPEAMVPVARALRDAGAKVEVTWSPGVAAMASLVEEAAGRGDVVVSVGGDGMVASVAGHVSRLGLTLGLVPAGRGNDFARMLGIPEDREGQARVLLEAEPRAVDLVSWTLPGAEPRVVVGSVYAGVDARAAEIVARTRRVPARLQYPLAAVRSLLTYRPGRYRVVVDGAVSEHLAATVVVANSAYYGSGMRVAPDAIVDDGLLDVIVVAAASRRLLMRALPSIYTGEHVNRPEVSVLRGSRVELSGALAGSGSGSIPVGGDGEPLGSLPVAGGDALAASVGGGAAVASVLPGALRVLA